MRGLIITAGKGIGVPKHAGLAGSRGGGLARAPSANEASCGSLVRDEDHKATFAGGWDLAQMLGRGDVGDERPYALKVVWSQPVL